jgi:hypothetical protein
VKFCVLICVCLCHGQVLSPRKVVDLWLSHYRTFLAYLAHDASSVRQTTSTLLLHVGEWKVMMVYGIVKPLYYSLTQTMALFLLLQDRSCMDRVKLFDAWFCFFLSVFLSFCFCLLSDFLTN